MACPTTAQEKCTRPALRCDAGLLEIGLVCEQQYLRPCMCVLLSVTLLQDFYSLQ